MSVKLGVVIPFYNEAGCAKVFVEQLLLALASLHGVSISVVLVNDGSDDETGAVLDDMAVSDSRIQVIHLWGNHGHQRALTAGIDACDADMLLMLDGDGQHPPSTAVKLVSALIMMPDCYIVQAVRNGKQGGFIKNMTSRLFYRLAGWIMPDVVLVPGASDFRVIRRPVVELLRRYPDRHRNLRVLLASLDVNTSFVDYQVAARISGQSGYGIRQMLRLAANGWFAFSASPLRISIFLMCFSGGVGLMYLFYVFAMFLTGDTVAGWTSIIAFLAFMFSAVFGVLAIMSEYVARIYEDVKGHPVYRIRPDSH